MYELLGRIVAFARMTQDQGLREAIEPALLGCLKGLESGDRETRTKLLHRLGTIPILRAEIVLSVVRMLGMAEISEDDRKAAIDVLSAQAEHASSDPRLREAFDPAIPLLIKELDVTGPETRQAAIQALGYLGGEARSAEESLRRLVRNDPLPDVRKVAKDALAAINGTAKMPPPARRSEGGIMGPAL